MSNSGLGLSPKIIGILLIPVILLLSLIAATYFFPTPIPNQMDLQIQEIGGNNIDTLSFKGKILVVEFFATYCQYCEESVANIVTTINNNDVSHVQFLSVSIDPVHDKDNIMNDFISQNNLTNYVGTGTNWLFTRDMSSQFEDYGVSAIPHTFLVNSQSIIVDQHIGLLDLVTLNTWVTNSTLIT